MFSNLIPNNVSLIMSMPLNFSQLKAIATCLVGCKLQFSSDIPTNSTPVIYSYSRYARKDGQHAATFIFLNRQSTGGYHIAK